MVHYALWLCMKLGWRKYQRNQVPTQDQRPEFVCQIPSHDTYYRSDHSVTLAIIQEYQNLLGSHGHAELGLPRTQTVVRNNSLLAVRIDVTAGFRCVP